MDIEIITNPNSGRGYGPEKAGSIGSFLARMGHKCRITLGRNREEAINWAKKVSRTADRLVVVGGDGSLSAVLDGLPEEPPPIALAPSSASPQIIKVCSKVPGASDESLRSNGRS